MNQTSAKVQGSLVKHIHRYKHKDFEVSSVGGIL